MKPENVVLKDDKLKLIGMASFLFTILIIAKISGAAVESGQNLPSQNTFLQDGVIQYVLILMY